MSKLSAPAIKVALIFGSCFICTFFSGVVFANEKYTGLALLGLFSILGYYLSLTFHEGGHIVGARLAKFKVYQVTIGPLVFTRNQAGKIEFSPNMDVRSGPGLVVAFPDTFERLRTRLLRVVGGGPLASLTCGLLFSLLSIIAGLNLSSRVANPFSIANYHAWWLTALIGLTGFASVIMFVVNTVPHQTPVADNDGHKLQSLLRNDEQGEREAQLVVLASSIARVRRPRNFSTFAIESMLKVKDDSRDEGLAHYFAYMKFLDSGDIPTAEMHAIRLAELYHKFTWRTQCEAGYWLAFHCAFYKKDVEAAREWFQEARRRQYEPSIVGHIAGATLGFLEGHHIAALEHANQFTVLLEKQRLQRWEIAAFYRQIMEDVTKRYINVIRPLLTETRK